MLWRVRQFYATFLELVLLVVRFARLQPFLPEKPLGLVRSVKNTFIIRVSPLPLLVDFDFRLLLLLLFVAVFDVFLDLLRVLGK